jgi:predicted kinase
MVGMTYRTSPQPTSQGCLIIVCGLPGSGKTTVARQLAEERRGVRLGPDEWMAALGVNVWDEMMRTRVEALQWKLAEDMLAAGVTVVVEWGTWARAERDALREQARRLGASVELRLLDVPAEELWRRIVLRDAEDPPIRWEDVAEWVTKFQLPSPDEMALYDIVV